MEINSNHKIVWLSLCVYLLTFLTIKIFLGGLNYWLLRHTVPLALFSISQILTVRTKFRRTYQIPILSTILFLTLLRMDVPSKWLFGFNWNFFVAIEYLGFSALYFEVFHRKIGNDFTSFTYTLLLLPTVGFLYEISLAPAKFIYFNVNFPLFIRPVLIMIPLVLYRIRSALTKIPTLIALIPTSLWLTYYHFNPQQPWWLPRLPMLLFWLVVLLNVKPQK